MTALIPYLYVDKILVTTDALPPLVWYLFELLLTEVFLIMAFSFNRQNIFPHFNNTNIIAIIKAIILCNPASPLI